MQNEGASDYSAHSRGVEGDANERGAGARVRLAERSRYPEARDLERGDRGMIMAAEGEPLALLRLEHDGVGKSSRSASPHVKVAAAGASGPASRRT